MKYNTFINVDINISHPSNTQYYSHNLYTIPILLKDFTANLITTY